MLSIATVAVAPLCLLFVTASLEKVMVTLLFILYGKVFEGEKCLFMTFYVFPATVTVSVFKLSIL